MKNRFYFFIGVIAIFLNIFSPFVTVALADEIIAPQSAEATLSPEPSETPAPSVEPSPTLSPDPSPTPPSESPVPTPEPTVEPSPTPEPALIDTTSTESQSSATLAPPVWQTNSDGSATTTNTVTLNQTYTFPQNVKVTVTFTKLPDNLGKLTIKEISTSTLSADNLNPVTSTAYDITSDMSDGTFEYTLTLPTPTTNNVEVKTSEDGQNFVTVGGVTAQTDTLTIANLNHFTLFVVVGTISNGTASTFTESSQQVVINEFMYNPASGNEWVELYNNTNSQINDLTDWALVDSANHVKNLSGYIPANGFYVYETNNFLNNTTSDGTGDTIYLKNGSTTVDEVTYQKKTGQGTIINAQAIASFPNEAQAVTRTSDAGNTWAIVTPTKGWSNSLPAPTSIFIDSSYSGVNTGAINQPFSTIQAGINLVSTGGTVNVAAGTYDEAVTVDESVTLLGAQAGIDARDRTGDESIVGTATGGFTVTADNVVIDGFTVSGVTACAQGGISTSPAASGYVIKNNIIKDNDLGLKFRSNGTSLSTVQFNLFQDNDELTCDVAKGLQTGQTSGDELHNALIDSNKFVGQTEGNDSYSMNFQGGVGWQHSDVTISNNEVLDSSVVLGNATNFVISGNNIDIDNDPDPGSKTAIYIGGNVNGLVVTGNTIDGKEYGFRIPTDFYGGIGPSTNIQVNSNTIVDNSLFGVFVEPGRYDGTLDATNNWWGSAAPNFDAIISGLVNFDPWYINAERTILSNAVVATPAPVVSPGGGGGDGGDGLGCANHDCNTTLGTPSQGQVLGASTKLAGLGLAFAPGTEQGVLGTSTTPTQELSTPTPTPNKESVKGVAASSKPTNVASGSEGNKAIAIALGILILASGTIFFFRKRIF